MGCRVILLLELGAEDGRDHAVDWCHRFDLGPAPVLKEIQRKDLPVRFAGRAFLCRGHGEPDHRGRHVLRAGVSGPG